MLTKEYMSMAQLESEHWWYLGLRDLLERTIRENTSSFRSHPQVLDIGCGTGANLQMLAEIFGDGALAGFDISPLAVEFAKKKCPRADVYLSDIRRPEFRMDSYDLVISCDALYVPGVEASLNGLRQVVNRIRRGGILVLHLPAYQWLYSAHDVAMGTKERYTTSEIRQMLAHLGLNCDFLTYRVTTLFPFVVLKRGPQLLRIGKRFEPHSDLMIPPKWLNALLYRILAAENRIISRHFSLPFGSSVFAIAKKP